MARSEPFQLSPDKSGALATPFIWRQLRCVMRDGKVMRVDSRPPFGAKHSFRRTRRVPKASPSARGKKLTLDGLRSVKLPVAGEEKLLQGNARKLFNL
jgi:hypothetical protein